MSVTDFELLSAAICIAVRYKEMMTDATNDCGK
jgi:hypothetical protein